MKLIYGVKDRPAPGKVVLFALQQMLAILAATIAVPAIIGNGMSQSAALFGAGAGTLIYLLFTKFKSPVFLGSSFAFISSMFAAFGGAASASAGYVGIIIGAVLAGLVYVVISLVIKFAGVKWLNKLMPAVVIGPTVAIIGLSLAGNAVGDLQTANYVKSYNYDDYKIVYVAENSVVENDKGGAPVKYFFNVTAPEGETEFIVLDKDADASKPVDAKSYHKDITVKVEKDGERKLVINGKETAYDDYSADYKVVEVINKEYTPSSDGKYTFETVMRPHGTAIYAVDKDVVIDSEGVLEIPAEKVHSDLTVTVADSGKTTITKVTGSPYVAIICGLITLAVTILVSVFAKKSLKTIPFIIGILAGYAAAACFTLIGSATGNDALMIVNFSAFSNMQWLPDFAFIKALEGVKEIDGAFIGTVAVAYVPVAFVVFAEHIADHKNISSILSNDEEKVDLLEDPGLSRTLLGDGVGSMVGAFFGGCPNTTYGESIGCVAISGNASIITIFCTAILAMAASFVAPFVTFLSTIPSCVMGGVCIALYGFIAVSGLKMVQKVDLDDNRNLFVVSVILIAGIGGLALTFGKVTVTSIACALILGILTNLMLSRKKDEK